MIDAGNIAKIGETLAPNMRGAVEFVRKWFADHGFDPNDLIKGKPFDSEQAKQFVVDLTDAGYPPDQFVALTDLIERYIDVDITAQDGKAFWSQCFIAAYDPDRRARVMAMDSAARVRDGLGKSIALDQSQTWYGNKDRPASPEQTRRFEQQWPEAARVKVR